MDFHLDPFLHPEEEEGKRRGRDASMGRYVFAPLPKGQMNMESEGQFKRERERGCSKVTLLQGDHGGFILSFESCVLV